MLASQTQDQQLHKAHDLLLVLLRQVFVTLSGTTFELALRPGVRCGKIAPTAGLHMKYQKMVVSRPSIQVRFG
jgi:hypothetical protein